MYQNTTLLKYDPIRAQTAYYRQKREYWLHQPTYLCTYNKDRRQCDQIGRFLKVIFDNFFTNTAQIFSNFFGK